MRTARLLTGTALAVAAAALCATPPAYGAGAEAGAGAIELYPATVAPGAEVTVNTAACGASDAVSGDAGAVGAGRFTLIPSAHEGDAVGHFKVPPSAQPGTYEVVARCSSGRRMTADLVVTLTSTQESRPQIHPRGSVKTGVGGALGPDPVQTAAGVAALAVAAAGGTWLLHRRARGDGI
ncbi:hypothetical protein ACFFS2_02395 [Streptomyces aurantiacus]|uniref:Integral membrane protein n=1 Tax=Streptomyces aurantiacus TaxID=47760 RepID=A0A7G1P694_9ACTN|nr:hypothetical protein [Streptomyces aurantiacus]BCL30799.1 hypothetical protein GCM10017557_56580 [Streptomyces aurantiacus]